MANRIYNPRTKRAAGEAARARKEGEAARRTEKSAWTCPYPAFTLPARLWLEGWQDLDARLEVERKARANG